MAYGIKIEVWGDRALFTRPELSTERYSYDVITPSAARGLIEAIYWHPGLKYSIDRIHVLNPISFTSVRRNEVKSKASAHVLKSAIEQGRSIPSINTQEDIAQRASQILVNVRYVIEAHFDITEKATSSDNAGKFKDILVRRLKKGQCYHAPYFGTREFPAKFRLYSEAESPCGYYSDLKEKDLGLMLYDMDYTDLQDITPIFFRAVMKNGVINVAESEVYR